MNAVFNIAMLPVNFLRLSLCHNHIISAKFSVSPH